MGDELSPVLCPLPVCYVEAMVVEIMPAVESDRFGYLGQPLVSLIRFVCAAPHLDAHTELLMVNLE